MKPGQPWPLADAVHLLDCIARALAHIHAREILHLDLKPENILYTGDGQIKISDFGLSIPHADATSLLAGRRFQGTLDYCAPEYRSGLSLDGRYDVFSLATMTYELLTGRLPGRVYYPASRRNPQLPSTLDDVLRRGLARDPNDRYASVTQFRDALADAGHRNQPRVPLRFAGFLAALALLILVPLTAFWWNPFAKQSAELPPLEIPGTQPPTPERPDRLVVLGDRPADLALFAGAGGGGLARGSAATVPVEQVLVGESASALQAGLPLPVWPTPRPVLVIQSPGALGFVHPLQDRGLGQRVIEHWPELLRAVVPPRKNLVKAGGFAGDCLTKDHLGALWRTGNTTGWDSTRQVELDRPRDQPDNPALLLTNLDPGRSRSVLGCYQSLTEGPTPGSLVVLRYRARSLHGKGSLAVYLGMPVVIPEGETGPIASRIRTFATPMSPEPGEPSNRLLHRSPAWVIVSDQWRTYLVVSECPPFPTRLLHRKVVIDLTATNQTATDQVWVDDVALFVWEPGSKP